MPSPLDVVLNLTDDEKRALLTGIAPKAQKFFEVSENPNWASYRKKDTYEVFSMKTDDSPVITIKSEGIVDAPMEEVAEFFSDFQKFTPVVDITYKDGKKLAIIGDGQAIDYASFKAPPLVANRDLLLHTFATKLENGVGISLAQSIERPEVPDRSGFVRAVLNSSGYLYRPASDPSKTFLQYILNIDPKGSIPVIVVNATAADQGENILRAQKHFSSKKSKK